MQIGIHHGGIFYEFVPWNGVVSFEISQWGHWYMSAENETHKVIVYLLGFFVFEMVLYHEKLYLEAKSPSCFGKLSFIWPS